MDWAVVEVDSLNVPSPRTSFACCIWADSLYIHGGWGLDGSLGDFWRFGTIGNVWHSLSDSTGQMPGPRSHHTLTAMASGNFYLIGGFVNRDDCTSDMFEYIPHTKKWSRVLPQGVPMSARAGHIAVRVGKNIVIHGGIRPSGGVSNEIHILNTETMTLANPLKIASGPSLSKHAAVELDEVIYVFGGVTDGNTLSSTLYAFDPWSNVWNVIPPPRGQGLAPCARSGHCMVATGTSQFLLFGGWGPNHVPLQDCWIFHTDTKYWEPFTGGSSGVRPWELDG